MTSSATLTAWRAEFAAELEGFERELAAARPEQVEAQAEYQRASNAWAGLRDTLLRSFGSTEEIASELYARLLDERRDMLRAASRRRGAATARIKMLEGSIAGRRLALHQIDRALDGTKPTNVREIAPRPKKPAAVEFDTVVMPREAV